MSEYSEEITATGKPVLVIVPSCEWSDFPDHALSVVDRFEMEVMEKIDGLDERLWLVRRDGAEYCISWDIWMREVTIMCWGDTPDGELKQLSV